METEATTTPAVPAQREPITDTQFAVIIKNLFNSAKYLKENEKPNPNDFAKFYNNHKKHKFIIRIKAHKYEREFPVSIEFVMRLRTIVDHFIVYEEMGHDDPDTFNNGVWYYTIETKLKYFYILYRFFYGHQTKEGQDVGGFDYNEIKASRAKYEELVNGKSQEDADTAIEEYERTVPLERDPTKEENEFVKNYIPLRERPTMFGMLEIADKLAYSEFIRCCARVMIGPFEGESEDEKLAKFKAWFNPLPLTKAQEAEMEDEERIYKEDYDANNDPLVKAAEQSVIDEKIKEQLAARPPLPESDDEDDTINYNKFIMEPLLA